MPPHTLSIMGFIITIPGTISTGPILTATAALTAFHIGLYTLIGRERKSPYLINSIFPILLYALIISAITIISVVLPDKIQSYFLLLSCLILALAFIHSFVIVYGVTIRFKYYVDSVHIKHLPIVRYFRRLPQKFSHKPTYAHNPIPIPAKLEAEIIELLNAIGKPVYQEKIIKSLAVNTDHLNKCNELLAKLGWLFLKNDFTVQYLTASRHPIEFIDYFKKYIETAGNNWAEYAKKIIVIDAYSPHFGFIDSIYEKKTQALEGLNITCNTSKMTFAGMHNAATRAFKDIQARSEKDSPRKPTLVIYEGAYALADLESPEQYRIFIRHVLPSERMWDSMFTVFVESYIPETDMKLISSYVSIKLDVKNNPTIEE